ncbi:prephenate dehydratase [Puccinia triticina 1-1 BBBD Race 1]|uniref:Prephenate dehydratase n=2 Tax=Puccinia triticina TaxID=208348 RepID=A0A0C4EVG9_PUCT1|nr:uncharacterized protein PtA15_4A561 [Puccinia triticina]OAV91009.1 prephenate dehydratase [Puccinia triticina 1-1 BBBD Race 1]WAQ84110.1 hypothetical protein PtA15_4A561 [Puccinia triticina]WAR54940.1 hypothetical protein PtB15_4B558 [Puccinia triticina]
MTVVTLPRSTATSQSGASVAYLGPIGTYSHEVTRKRFSGPEYSLVPYATIHDAVHALIPSPSRTRASWAVVPIENSYFGPVVETREVLSEPQVIRYTRTLDQRIRLKVEHCLIARKPSTPAKSSPSPSPESHPPIRTIYSHAQALGQCQKYIALHYPHARTVPTSSTAEAATLVANDPSRSSLAICSPSCVEYFPELEVLDFNIQDAGQENVTTFIVLGSKD